VGAALEIAVEELRFRLRGELYEPGEPGFEESCTPFDAMIERRPRLVARCSAAEDVIATLAFAREQELAVAVRGGGHSVAAPALYAGEVVIDLRGMRDVEVDRDRGVARVGGGASLADLDRGTQAQGLACEDLLAAQLVTAEGRIVRAAADENPDLLWALRTGNANFGVVTSLELRLRPTIWLEGP
jgi:FAD/FMN-containing dehydrogenase